VGDLLDHIDGAPLVDIGGSSIFPTRIFPTPSEEVVIQDGGPLRGGPSPQTLWI
jgi:hypothetical protein